MIHRPTQCRIGTAPTFPVELLDRIYALPRRFISFEEWQRYWNLDVPSLDDAELGREHRRVQHRADYGTDDAAAAWLAGRLVTIREEWMRRSRTGRVEEVRRMPQPLTGMRASNHHTASSPDRASLRVAGVLLDPPRRKSYRG